MVIVSSSLSRSCILTKTVLIETTLRFNFCISMSTKLICIGTIDLCPSHGSVEAVNAAVRAYSLKIQDHTFETSRIALMGLESLEVCMKLMSLVESSRHRLTHSVSVKLASINTNSLFANSCELADVSSVNNNFTCKHF